MNNRNIYLQLMDTMMEKMMDITPGQNTDRCFTEQMIPHHEGAVAMAKYEIQYGKDVAMVQLAKSILAEQTIEIQQMNSWLKNMDNNGKAIPAFAQSMEHTMHQMMSDMPRNEALQNVDRSFALVMRPHHQAAIDMARNLLAFSKNPEITAFAKEIISSQQIEIEQMNLFLNK